MFLCFKSPGNSFVTLLHSQAVPGPGKYEIKSQFSIKPPPVNQEEPIIHPPFGTQSRVRHTPPTLTLLEHVLAVY